jgi:hypothetical protein
MCDCACTNLFLLLFHTIEEYMRDFDINMELSHVTDALKKISTLEAAVSIAESIIPDNNDSFGILHDLRTVLVRERIKHHILVTHGPRPVSTKKPAAKAEPKTKSKKDRIFSDFPENITDGPVLHRICSSSSA